MNDMRLADTHHTPIPTVEMTRPTYGGPQRDAVNSVVGSIVEEICREIGEMRTLLDQIEQVVLESGAKAKHQLNEQINVCTHVKDELKHMRKVANDIREREKSLHE